MYFLGNVAVLGAPSIPHHCCRPAAACADTATFYLSMQDWYLMASRVACPGRRTDAAPTRWWSMWRCTVRAVATGVRAGHLLPFIWERYELRPILGDEAAWV